MSFPKGFLWGGSISAAQIEGVVGMKVKITSISRLLHSWFS